MILGGRSLDVICEAAWTSVKFKQAMPNNNVTVTSKSYSNGVNAGYTTLARQLDQQIRQMPDLIHVHY